MARPIRIQYPGAFYHIMTRGNGRSNIFDSAEDYQDFLIVFFDIINRYNWTCYAYCLMPNHYHLLIRTNDANLSLGMRQLNGVYTQNYNIRHKKVGHLFQGRFKSVLVEEEGYKYQLIRYIALNPLRAKIVHRIENWKWSSCLELMNKIDKTGCVETREILSNFDQDENKAREVFLGYLMDKVENEDGLSSLKGGIILGSAEFIDKIKGYLRIKEKELEIPVKERLVSRPSLKELFGDEVRTREARNKVIYKAHVDYGYLLSEVASCLGIHYTTISRIFKKENDLLSKR